MESCSYKSKLSRRRKKYSSVLLSETGIHEVSKSKFLMVCNAGLVSGFEVEKLIQLFAEHCKVKNAVMIPGKSYCFVECTHEDEAEKAYTTINGKLVIPEVKGPLYLLYTESVPQTDYKIEFGSNKLMDLIIIDDFISKAEEEMLIQTVQAEFLNSGNNLKHRLVKHYGYEFNYKTNNIKSEIRCDPIPDQWLFIMDRLHKLEKLKDWTPDQLTINYYRPGQGIPFHVDTHSAFDDFILSLSLGSDVVMDFKNHHSKRFSTLLPGRSLLIMSGESRYGWSHGITPRKFDIVENQNGLTTQIRGERISFTMRRLRKNGLCECSYPQDCDTQKSLENEHLFKIDENLASELENVHVHQVYDVIANHFSETRHKPWPNIEQFVKSFEIGSVFVDVGCGNGKYFGLNNCVYEVGCDRSSKLSEECRSRGFESVICDCLQLPYRSSSADYCVCIAVIHHLSTEERRIKAIKELIRILRSSGKALIYVWAKNQKQNQELSSYLKQSGRNKGNTEGDIKNVYSVKFKNDFHNGLSDQINEVSLPVHVNRTQFKEKDMLVPWKLKPKGTECSNDGPVFLRYYHVFSEGELERLCESVTEAKIVKTYYDQGNWCIILEKV